jgi:Ca-activated chloride channel family protein
MKTKVLLATGLILVAAGCARKAEQDLADERVPIAVSDAAPPAPTEETMTACAPAAQKRMAAPGYLGGVEMLEAESYTVYHNTESYDHLPENPFLDARRNPLSTFSIDVDTASYSNVRRFLRMGELPPAGAVRIEEMINYFPYDYPRPAGNEPFAVDVEVADAPWNPNHRLVRVGIGGMELSERNRPAGNLVFLLDVSGSMQAPNKLPLLKSAMKMLVDNLGADDRVSIVVYAGAAGLALPSTPAGDRVAILEAIDALEAGGSTAGGAGIRLAYSVARDNRIDGGINRVILCTDGDFNVGVSSESELVRLIEGEAADGIFLTVLGFGMGNYKDSGLEKLADEGNGNYAYIDTRHEARKVLVEQAGGTLVTIAKDVKIQVEFNPALVQAYRLVGYENRVLRAQDFNDDTKDAGEIGAGHTVTALYEIVPPGVEIDLPDVDDLKYQDVPAVSGDADGAELLTLKVRYKAPDGDTSRLLSFPVEDDGLSIAAASDDFRFAAAVAGFGMALRRSEHLNGWKLGGVVELAREGLGADSHGYRAEFVELVEEARTLSDG